MDIHITDRPSWLGQQTMLEDYTYRAESWEFSNSDNAGFADALMEVVLSEQEWARWQIRRRGYLTFRTQTEVAWEGRIEDLDTEPLSDGRYRVRLGAYGHLRAFNDVPYSALWSESDLSRWQEIREDTGGTWELTPDLFEVTTGGELVIAPRKDETYDPNKRAVIGYKIPHRSRRQIVGLQFTYEVDAPDANWRAQLYRYTDDAIPVYGGAPWNIPSEAGVISGTRLVWFAPTNQIAFSFFYNAAAAAYANDTGLTYLKITRARVITATARRVNTTLGAIAGSGSRTVTIGSTANVSVGMQLTIGTATDMEQVTVGAVGAGTITAVFSKARAAGASAFGFVGLYADEILKDLILFVRETNPNAFQEAAVRIAPPDIDLIEARYEDIYPAEIIAALGETGDSAGRIWQTRINSEGFIIFQPRTETVPPTWEVDARPAISRRLDRIQNSAYALYQDAAGFPQRTTTATNQTAVIQWGLQRTIAVDAGTDQESTANTIRNVAIGDGSTHPTVGAMQVTTLATLAGEPVELWRVRGGQTVRIREMPFANEVVERLRNFIVGRATYNHLGELTISPEADPERLAIIERQRQHHREPR